VSPVRIVHTVVDEILHPLEIHLILHYQFLKYTKSYSRG